MSERSSEEASDRRYSLSKVLVEKVREEERVVRERRMRRKEKCLIWGCLKFYLNKIILMN